jgi:MFS family permease
MASPAAAGGRLFALNDTASSGAAQSAAERALEPPGRRALLATYIAGLFAMGYIDVFVFLMPLYGGALNLSATEIGALVGARSVLPVFLSIHVGTLMDRFGTRRVTAVFAAIAIVCAPLFPLAPWFPALLALQIVNGGVVSFGWAGAQTLIAQICHGDADYLGRFSFKSRVGTTAAPIVIGAIWDWGGKWPAYLFGVLWGLALLAALRCAPEPGPTHDGLDGEAGPPPVRFRPRDLLPRLSDYVASFALMAIPAIALSAAVIFVRNATSGIQNSLYVVYLGEQGHSATVIGFLFAAVEIASGLGSLLGGRAMRMGRPHSTMVTGTVIAIALIAITPLIAGSGLPVLVIIALLLVAQGWRGMLQGVIQPVMFAVQSRAVGRHQQGSVVGLRQTVTRISAIAVPPLMGAIADHSSLALSFYVLGGLLLALCVPLALLTRRVERPG